MTILVPIFFFNFCFNRRNVLGLDGNCQGGEQSGENMSEGENVLHTLPSVGTEALTDTVTADMTWPT